MEKFALELSMDSIMSQASNAFQGLFDGAMNVLNGISEGMSSLF